MGKARQLRPDIRGMEGVGGWVGMWGPILVENMELGLYPQDREPLRGFKPRNDTMQLAFWGQFHPLFSEEAETPPNNV